MSSKKPITYQSRIGRLGQEICIKAKQLSVFRNAKLGSPEFEKSASALLRRKAILPQIERVLIIPKNEQSFYLIFGYGDVLADDLYVLWNRKNSEIQYLPFKFDLTKKEFVSTLEVFKKLGKSKEAGLPPWDETGRRKIYIAHIEEIKQALKNKKSLSDGKPLKIKSMRKSKSLESFDISCLERSPSLKHVSVVLERFKGASFVLLRDVFNPRYKIKLEQSKISLVNDHYTISREFLKTLGLYSERRGGSNKRPGRLKPDDEEELIKYLIGVCQQKNILKPTKKMVKDAFLSNGIDTPPTTHLIQKIRSVIFEE